MARYLRGTHSGCLQPPYCAGDIRYRPIRSALARGSDESVLASRPSHPPGRNCGCDRTLRDQRRYQSADLVLGTTCDDGSDYRVDFAIGPHRVAPEFHRWRESAIADAGVDSSRPMAEAGTDPIGSGEAEQLHDRHPVCRHMPTMGERVGAVARVQAGRSWGRVLPASRDNGRAADKERCALHPRRSRSYVFPHLFCGWIPFIHCWAAFWEQFRAHRRVREARDADKPRQEIYVDARECPQFFPPSQFSGIKVQLP